MGLQQLAQPRVARAADGELHAVVQDRGSAPGDGKFDLREARDVQQVVAMDPVNVGSFLSQPYIRDPQKTVKDLLGEYVGKLGENIKLVRFIRYGLGEAQ